MHIISCGIAVAAFIGAASGPARAQDSRYYIAVEAVPGAQALDVISDVAWRRTSAGLAAPRASSPPEIVCQRVARRLGTLRAFSAGGEAFDQARLGACNAHARRRR